MERALTTAQHTTNQKLENACKIWFSKVIEPWAGGSEQVEGGRDLRCHRAAEKRRTAIPMPRPNMARASRMPVRFR